MISIVEPVVQHAGLELVDLRFLLEQGGWTLRVQIDLPIDQVTDVHEVPTERVSLSECEEMSRELSAVLDVDDPIKQAYSLEISSPGIDRPLRTAAHFAHFVGSEAKIQLAIPLQLAAGERKNFKGVLRGVTGEPADRVAIDVDNETFELPIADIDQAKLVPDWEAVMHGKSGVGQRAAHNPNLKPGQRPSQKPKHRAE
ncbi:MAG TPA: ribosome maturation factor RimP [Kofleriaceae bacterium]|nr:ribosome maturation factor RimP [Kofleriaceae bacterium]